VSQIDLTSRIGAVVKRLPVMGEPRRRAKRLDAAPDVSAEARCPTEFAYAVST